MVMIWDGRDRGGEKVSCTLLIDAMDDESSVGSPGDDIPSLKRTFPG